MFASLLTCEMVARAPSLTPLFSVYVVHAIRPVGEALVFDMVASAVMSIEGKFDVPEEGIDESDEMGFV